MSGRSLTARVARGLRPALLGPLRFAIDSGHLRSSLLCQAVDRQGHALPWITYPAIAFLESFAWSDAAVLEWGAGNSTLWWLEQEARVLSIEHDARWVAELRRRIGTATNAELVCHIDPIAYAQAPLGRRFDVSVIDGQARFQCARTALEVTSPGGAIILDNAEQTWAEPGQTGFPILELLRAAGWRRFDFQGFAPSVARPHVTSVFIRPECTLFERQRPPRVRSGVVPG